MTSTGSRHDALADRMMKAIEDGDLDAVRGCYAPDLRLWMNLTRDEVGRDGAIEVLQGFVAMTASRRYEVTRRVDLADGYLQEHTLHVVGTNGAEAAAAACLVVEVTDDAITSIREYLDSRSLADAFR
ncbi:MAG TPA: nuclear transport factor 2 family protein [Acidimicrobiales bacterium]|nr:nuclear transport factor 2 family protein [Acidimicrobiales bacterium]